MRKLIKKLIFPLLILICLTIWWISSKSSWNSKLLSIEYSKEYCKVLNSSFLTSDKMYKEDNTEYVCTQQKASVGKEYLLFELEATYNTERIFEGNIEGFKLKYGNKYKVEADDVYLSFNGTDWTYIDGTAINHHEIKIDPLSDNTTVKIRGAFEISKKIETDKSKSLVLINPLGKNIKLR